MTHSEFRATLRILDAAASLLDRRRAKELPTVRRHVRRLSLELQLLRIGLRQSAPESRRN